MNNPRTDLMPPMLKKLSLNRFCGFSAFEVEFKTLTVLVGLNNGGKSTILRAIKLALDAVNMSLPKFQTEVKKHEAQFDEIERAYRAAFEQAQKEPPPRVKMLEKNYRDALAAQIKNRPAWLCDLPTLVKQLYIREPLQLYHRHDHEEPWIITLQIQSGNDTVHISLTEHNPTKVALTVALNNKDMWSLPHDTRPALFQTLRALTYSLFAPISALAPAESSLSWPQVDALLLEGKAHEIWRNRLHWLYEGKPTEAHQRVAARVQEWLTGIGLNLPSRTRGQRPEITLTYEDHGQLYEMVESGGGMRTLIEIAAAVELGTEQLLLFDEPDAHLHSSLQRQMADFLETSATRNRQIILATHGPDMIDQFSVDSLVWIDRLRSSGRVCDNAAKALIDLGALTHAEALNLLDAQAILYFESKTDRKVIQALMATCAKQSLLSVCQVADLQGIGDASHLPHLLRLLEKHHKRKIAGVVIRDADYTSDASKEPETQGALLTCALPCKEIENLLLLQPEAIAEAANKAITKRRERTVEAAAGPSVELIEQFIDTATEGQDVRNAVENRWIVSKLNPDGLDAGILSKIRADFEEIWQDAAIRRRICPGKKVLRLVKSWLQKEYRISFAGLEQMFAFYEPTTEIREIFNRIEKHLKSVLGDNYGA